MGRSVFIMGKLETYNKDPKTIFKIAELGMKEEKEEEKKEKASKREAEQERKQKIKRYKQKQREKAKEYKKFKKFVSRKLKKPRRILKKQVLQVNLGSPDYRAPSVLGDENRFFTGVMEQEKRSMFFS
jgi:cation diffusion facilitator CzcD-associated flavoprotein CzcO